ncbi:G-protein coupled receptor GRL101-like [Styela clava]
MDGPWIQCQIQDILFGYQICNGYRDCRTETTKTNDELNCPKRFYCKSGLPINIPDSKLCDTIQDCEDDSDEMYCTDETHFYCEDGGKVLYINRNKACDGAKDCTSGKDEVKCRQECTNSVFSNEEYMIENKYFLIAAWIISISAVVGNILVIIYSVHDFFCRRGRPKGNERKNKLLLLNLSISDLLVGIYNLSICIQSHISSGHYCQEDQEWRSGITCSALGAILVIGSESSVFTLILLSSFRSRTILKSFERFPLNWFFKIIALSWITSIILALFPLLPFAVFEDYFIDSVRFADNPFFATVKSIEVDELNNWFLVTGIINNNNSTITGSWDMLEHFAMQINPNYTIVKKFGYYSAHSVCLPRLLPDPKTNKSWGYSLIFMLINFSSFFVIFISYVIIYRKSVETNLAVESTSSGRSKALQKKISFILLTDFCCWMPVCIMGILQVIGIDISLDGYLAISLFLIPINSAFNPVIYYLEPSVVLKKLSSTFCRRRVKDEIDRMEAHRRSGTRKSAIGVGIQQSPTAGIRKQDDMANM